MFCRGCLVPPRRALRCHRCCCFTGSGLQLPFLPSLLGPLLLCNQGGEPSFSRVKRPPCTAVDHLPSLPNEANLFQLSLFSFFIWRGEAIWVRARVPQLLHSYKHISWSQAPLIGSGALGWIGNPQSSASSLFQDMEIFAFLVSGPWHRKVRGVMVWFHADFSHSTLQWFSEPERVVEDPVFSKGVSVL